MHREDVIAHLKTAEPTLRAFGVAALYLFGSRARGEARDDSGIDVYVDVAPDVSFGLVPYIDARQSLEDAVGRKVAIDYSTREALSPYIRADVEKEALRIF